MLCLSPLLPPLSSAPSFLYPPCSVCPVHSLLPLPLPYNQKSFSQMRMLAFPSIIHDQSFVRARDDGLATWEILQRVTALPRKTIEGSARPHLSSSSVANAMQCNGNALVQRDRKRHWGNCLPPILFSLLFPSHLSLALLFSSDAIADVPSSISISPQNSLSPFRPP